MVQPLTLPLIGALTLAGVGGGIYLGNAALGEINPIYYQQPETRFHADLSANPPSTNAPPIRMARADDPALRTGCIGCRTYPEEYFPIHDASVDRYSGGYAVDVDAPVPAALEQEPDPEAERIRREIEKVQRYARGSAFEAGAVQMASAEAEGQVAATAAELPTAD